MPAHCSRFLISDNLIRPVVRGDVAAVPNRVAPERCGHSAAHQAVEPVVVRLFGAQLPLVDRPAAAFSLDPVLGREVLREAPVLFRSLLYQPECPANVLEEALPSGREYGVRAVEKRRKR